MLSSASKPERLEQLLARPASARRASLVQPRRTRLEGDKIVQIPKVEAVTTLHPDLSPRMRSNRGPIHFVTIDGAPRRNSQGGIDTFGSAARAEFAALSTIRRLERDTRRAARSYRLRREAKLEDCFEGAFAGAFAS